MKHNLRITVLMVAIFMLAQMIGLLVLNAYIDVEKTEQTGKVEFEQLPLGIERPQVEERTSFVYIVVAIIVGTALLFLLMKLNAHFLWKAWYFLAIFMTLTISFGAFVSSLAAAVAAGVLALWKMLKPNIIVHNLTELFVYGGLAAIFAPIMNVFSGIMMLLLISVYDMYAVWKSKHMITLAKFQAKQKIFAGFFVPYKMPKLNMSGKASGKKIKTAVLGGGDIGFPLIFAGIVMKSYGFGASLIIPLFATIALMGLFIYGKPNRFYPAMPFISAGCLIGYGLVLLL